MTAGPGFSQLRWARLVDNLADIDIGAICRAYVTLAKTGLTSSLFVGHAFQITRTGVVTGRTGLAFAGQFGSRLRCLFRIRSPFDPDGWLRTLASDGDLDGVFVTPRSVANRAWAFPAFVPIGTWFLHGSLR